RAGRADHGPPAAAAAADPDRLHDVPRRNLADSAQLGREVVPQRHLLQRSRPGRPLRRVGRAGALLNRGAGGFQVIALIGACERRARKGARHSRLVCGASYALSPTAACGPSSPQPLDWASPTARTGSFASVRLDAGDATWPRP